MGPEMTYLVKSLLVAGYGVACGMFAYAFIVASRQYRELAKEPSHRPTVRGVRSLWLAVSFLSLGSGVFSIRAAFRYYRNIAAMVPFTLDDLVSVAVLVLYFTGVFWVLKRPRR